MIPFYKKGTFLFKKFFQIDCRSLAIFRICMGLILLVDLMIRSTSITAHYSDFGVLSREAFFSNFNNQDLYYSLYHISGNPTFILFLFIIAGIIAFCYMIGYKTKISAVLSFILLVSLHNKNTVVLHGGDSYLRMLLFWSLLLPLNAKWSVDNWINPIKKDIKSIYSFGSLGLMLQIIILYVFTALHKDHPMWTEDFTAVYYALSIEQFTTPLGLELLKHLELTKLLTVVTIYLEKYIMLLFFIPFFTAQFRLLGLAILFLFHMVGINLTMELGIFHYVCSTALLVFIPGFFWEKLGLLLVKWKSKYAFVKQISYKQQWTISYVKEFFVGTGNYNLVEASSTFFVLTKKIGYWTTQAFALFIAVYILLWNLRELKPSVETYFSYNNNWIARVLRIDQRWDMFAPYPMISDGWFIVLATLDDGTQIDLFNNNQPVDYAKPQNVAGMYKDERWRKYLMQLWNSNFADYRKYYLEYLYSEWEDPKSRNRYITEIEFIYMLENTPAMGLPNPEPEIISLQKEYYK